MTVTAGPYRPRCQNGADRPQQIRDVDDLQVVSPPVILPPVILPRCGGDQEAAVGDERRDLAPGELRQSLRGR